jgi:hypothetical protein
MKNLKPNSRLPARYGVRRETIWRWKHDPNVDFPEPDAVINGIDYYSDKTLDEFDKATLAKRKAERRNSKTA